ncbi:MAG: hypothetical protein ACRC6T_11825 [Sarcina sp.]
MKKELLDKNRVLNSYKMDNLTTKELSILYNCSIRRIQKILKPYRDEQKRLKLEIEKLNFKKKIPKKTFPNDRLRRHLNSLEIENIIKDFKLHMSNGDLARKYNTSIGTVRKYTKPYFKEVQIEKNILKSELIKFKTKRVEKEGLIYSFECLKGYRYIGKTTNLHARCFVHISDLKRKRHSSLLLQEMYSKEPIEIFSNIKNVEILENNIQFNDLDLKEKYYQLLNFNNGYKVLGMSKDLLESLLYKDEW